MTNYPSFTTTGHGLWHTAWKRKNLFTTFFHSALKIMDWKLLLVFVCVGFIVTPSITFEDDDFAEFDEEGLLLL